VEIDLWVCPRASRNEVKGRHRGRVKVQIQDPPVEGAANRRIVKLLAKVLGVAGGEVVCLRGHASRSKTYVVGGIDVETVMSKLGL